MATREERTKATREAYSRVFGSTDGQLVLADLFKANVMRAGVTDARPINEYQYGRLSLVLDLIRAAHFNERQMVEMVEHEETEAHREEA